MGYEQRFLTADVPQLEQAKPRLTRPQLYILLLFVAAGAAARFYGIGSRTLWIDETYSAWFANLSWHDLWVLTPQYETHPPFYYSMLKAWTGLFGDTPGALRGLTAVAGLLAIVTGTLAARTLTDLTTVRRPFFFIGAVCALMALSPRLVIGAQDARTYGVMVLAYGAAMLAWLRLTHGFRSQAGSAGVLRDWALLGISTAFILWLHALGILFAAGLLAALLLTAAPGATAARWVRLAVTVSLTGLAYLPCLVMMLDRTGDWGSGWLGWEPAKFPGQLMNLYGQFKIDEPVTPVIAALVTCGLLFAGVRFLWSRGDRPLAAGLALLLLFPPLAAALISQLATPVFLPRTMLAVTAPAYLIAAYGLAQLPGRQFKWAAALLAGTLLVNLAQTLVRPPIESWREVAAILEREAKPGDLIWAYPNEAVLPLQQAMEKPRPMTSIPAPFPAVDAPGHRISGTPAVVTLDGPLAADWLRRNPAPQGATIWLVTYKSYYFDANGEVVKQLMKGRIPGRSFGGDELKVQRWHPAPMR